MMEHAGYLNGLVARDLVVLFGPVADSAGLWGCAIVEAGDEGEVQTLLAEDPVIRAGAGFRYDVFPMPSVTLRRSGA